MIEVKNFFKTNIFCYLIILFPLLLITGPFLPDLSILFFCIYFIINYNKFKFDQFFEKKIHWIFILFYIIICISSLTSDYSLYSIKSSVFYLRFGIFSLAIYFLFLHHQHIILNLSNFFLIILVVLFVDTIFQYIFGFNLLGWKFENDYRVTSLFGDDEILGSYIARLFPFMISIFIFSKKNFNFNFNNLLFFFVFISSSLITLMSGERTSLALLILSIILMFFTCKNIRKLIFFSFLAISIILTSLILTNEKTKKRMLNQTVKQLGLTSKSERMVIFSKTYEGHYTIALKMFKEKPILGHGPKTFRKFCSEPDNYLNDVACTTHPHNILMQLLSETGIMGTFFYIIIFFYLIFKITKIAIQSFFNKNKYEKDYLTLMYIFYFINLFPFAPSGNFFNNWLSAIYYFPLGYMFFLINFKRKIQ